MAAAKGKSAASESAEYVTLDDGSHAIGATIEGVFVPFTTMTAARAQQLIDRGKELAEAADENGEGE